jgi:hypothetical protein
MPCQLPTRVTRSRQPACEGSGGLVGAPAAPDLQTPTVAVPVPAKVGITYRPYDHMTLANRHDVTALWTQVVLDCPMFVHALDLVALKLKLVVHP